MVAGRRRLVRGTIVRSGWNCPGEPAPTAQLVISANPGCSLQIAFALAARGRDMAVGHIAEVRHAPTAVARCPLLKAAATSSSGDWSIKK